MTPSEFRKIREHIGLDRADFATELGYSGSVRNRVGQVMMYEEGQRQIPAYIARLAFLLQEHFDTEERHLPEWPESCAILPPKPAGEKRK